MDSSANKDGAIDRRSMLLRIGGATTAVASALVADASASPVAPANGETQLRGLSVQVADLTHKLTQGFNFSKTNPRISKEPIDGSGKAVGMRLNKLSLNEHTGTHIDAPSHFDEDAPSLGELPVSDLVVPLVVVDMRAKYKENVAVMIEPGDIEEWEAQNGALPNGCCVALWSGMDPLEVFANLNSRAGKAPTQGPGPGFSPEAARMLMEKRSVKGIAVDGMSIDARPNVPSYPVHQEWLRSGRWGIEGITNLGAVPPNGALLVVGAAPIEGATGIPIRAIALF